MFVTAAAAFAELFSNTPSIGKLVQGFDFSKVPLLK
jgi:hypothetical protein